MPLDPDVAAHLAGLPPGGSFAVAELAPDEARRRVNASYAALYGPACAIARVEEAVVEGPRGPIPVRIYADGPAPRASAVYLHGGGWVLGDLDSHDGVCRELARLSRLALVAVDYRLAPEHPFPAPLEDAWAALAAVAAGRLAVPAAPLAVCGDSAGAALAAVCARRARDAGVELALQLLVCPVADSDLTRPSYFEHDAIGPSRAALDWFWRQYVGPAGNREHPDTAPLRAADLAGLCPALVVTAEYDTLRDEGEAYAAALAAAGVDVRCERVPGVVHGFFRMRTVCARAEGTLRAMAEALRHAAGG